MLTVLFGGYFQKLREGSKIKKKALQKGIEEVVICLFVISFI